MTASTLTDASRALIPLARDVFGLEVARRLPVTQSFSSQVLRFVDPRGEAFVIKEPWSATKALREVDALRRLVDHPRTPALLDHRQHEDRYLLLLRGLDGEPMSASEAPTAPLCRAIGEAMAQLHDHREPDFDGAPTWHTLLRRNAESYGGDIGEADRNAAQRAYDLLLAHLSAVPESSRAAMTHFDLRPGNLLIRHGALVGVIDFEACRGGHPSMDLFKLWEELAEREPRALAWIMEGYGEGAAWAAQIHPLMRIYSLYHGLAGLAWCYRRDRPGDPFILRNRRLITSAERALAGHR